MHARREVGSSSRHIAIFMSEVKDLFSTMRTDTRLAVSSTARKAAPRPAPAAANRRRLSAAPISTRGAAQREGVYAALRGPEYQTMAEARLLAGLGADCVGMSTVLEAIALQQLGVAVSGLSVVSDLSLASEPTDPQEVLRLAAGARPTLVRSIEAVLEEIGPAGH